MIPKTATFCRPQPTPPPYFLPGLHCSKDCSFNHCSNAQYLQLPKMEKLFSLNLQLLIFIFIFIFIIFIKLSTSQLLKQCIDPPAVKAGFWLSNSNRYSSLSNITSSLYTHLYYYSLALNETSYTVALPPQDQLLLLANFSATLKSGNPSLKTMLSIATNDYQTNSSNTSFSTMVADPNLRSAFIDSSIKLASTHGFDGLDVAWQFPSSQADMSNFAILLDEWRTRVNDAAEDVPSRLLLTATVYFSVHLFDGQADDLDYPVDVIAEKLDWVNARCFGYHKSTELTTAADAPLYYRTTHFSTSYGIQSWMDAGVPTCKLVMGVPLYGRSWYLKNKEKNGLGAQAVAAGPRLKMSNQTGLMAHFEIEGILKENSSSLVYDNLTVSSYFHNGGLWVSFDSEQVVDEKIKFAVRNGLLGYSLWPISFEDSNHTISKQASDAWQRYKDSGEGKIGYLEAPSPAEMNHQDLAPNNSADRSNNKERSFLMILHFGIPLFLLFGLLSI